MANPAWEKGKSGNPSGRPKGIVNNSTEKIKNAYTQLIEGNLENIQISVMNFNEPMLRDGALAGKTIVVTGGGTGLGRSMSKYFLQLGANVVIASRKLNVL